MPSLWQGQTQSHHLARVTTAITWQEQQEAIIWQSAVRHRCQNVSCTSMVMGTDKAEAMTNTAFEGSHKAGARKATRQSGRHLTQSRFKAVCVKAQLWIAPTCCSKESGARKAKRKSSSVLTMEQQHTHSHMYKRGQVNGRRPRAAAQHTSSVMFCTAATEVILATLLQQQSCI